MANTWLENLKEGDKVIYGLSWESAMLEPVRRITATQIMVSASKFRRRDGMLIGYGREFISEATPKAIAEMEDGRTRRTLIYQIQRTAERKSNLENRTTDELRAVANILLPSK